MLTGVFVFYLPMYIIIVTCMPIYVFLYYMYVFCLWSYYLFRYSHHVFVVVRKKLFQNSFLKVRHRFGVECIRAWSFIWCVQATTCMLYAICLLVYFGVLSLCRIMFANVCCVGFWTFLKAVSVPRLIGLVCWMLLWVWSPLYCDDVTLCNVW